MNSKIIRATFIVESLEQRLQLSGAADLVHSTASLSTPRTDIGATTVGDMALFAGGITDHASLDTVDIYNARTQEWSVAHLSQKTGNVAARIGSLAFFAGGDYDPVKSIEIYDGLSGTWSAKSFKGYRRWRKAVSLPGIAMFFGVSSRTSQGTSGNVLDIYNASTQRWTGSPDPSGINIVAVGTKAISSSYNSQTAHIYDSLSKAWSTATIPIPGANLDHPIALGTKVFFRQSESNGTTIGVIYDSVTGSWTQITIPLMGDVVAENPNEERASAVALGNKLIFSSGLRIDNNTGLPIYASVVNVYDGSTGRWSTAPISVPRTGMAATVVGQQAIFAGGAIDVTPLNFDFAVQSAVDIYTDTNPSAVLSGGLAGGIIQRDKATVINTGDADLSAGYTIQLYASPDRTLGDAILVGSLKVNSALSAGASLPFSVRTVIPKGTPGGTYHLLAAVQDASGNITPIAAEDATFRVRGSSAAAHAVKFAP